MVKHFICFAGAAACGKTPVATYLSWQTGLPVFNNDAIRTEVHEDTGSLQLDIEEYDTRQEQRLKELVATGRSCILDASVDRKWQTVSRLAGEHRYRVFLVSFDLSEQFLLALIRSKPGYDTDPELNRRYVEQHQSFLDIAADDVTFIVDEGNYPERLRNTLQAYREWINAS